MKLDQVQLCALHESAHCLVRIARKGHFKAVRVDGALGATEGVDRIASPRDRFACCVAGVVAERLHVPTWDDVLGNEGDCQHARACGLSRADAAEVVAEVASELVQRHDALCAVAGELAIVRRLDERDVRAIVREHKLGKATVPRIDWGALLERTTAAPRADAKRTDVRVVRLDFVQLDAPVQIGDSMRFTGRAASSAPMTYTDPDGSSHVETRGPEVIPDIIAQLPGKPIAFEHPLDDKMYSDGTSHPVSGRVVSARLDTDAAGTQYAVATFDVTDPKLLKAIKRGPVRQLSLGYRCDIAPKGRQKDLSVDHLACVEAGRCAGGQCSIRADRHDCSCVQCTACSRKKKPVKKSHIDTSLAAAEERSALRSQHAYLEPHPRWGRKDDDVYSAPPLAAPKLRGADRGSPDSQDLSSRIAKGLTNTTAYPREKAPVDPGVGPYRSPEVGDLPQPEDDSDEMNMRIAQARALDASGRAYLTPNPRFSRAAILDGQRQGRRGDAAPAKPVRARTNLAKAEERSRRRSERAHTKIPSEYSRDAIIARGKGNPL